MANFKEYRQFSPILVNEEASFIIELPSEKCSGFRISGHSMLMQENQFAPIAIDNTLYKVFKHREEYGTLQFKNSEHIVSLDKENNFCYIDGEPYGVVSFVHELKNIVEDTLGIHMTYYFPPSLPWLSSFT